MNRDTTMAALRGDEIRCDANGCEARIITGLDLSQERSILRAHLEGWQAWLGTLRAYHRCPAHFAPEAAGMPERHESEAFDRAFEHEAATV